jgi:hypothetical protein
MPEMIDIKDFEGNQYSPMDIFFAKIARLGP